MIPTLYAAAATTFTTNGIGRLADAISCKVVEERNGAFELEMQYPVGGQHYDDLATDRIIYAQPAYGKPPQPFRIYRIAKSSKKTIMVYAQHVSYQVNGIPVIPEYYGVYGSWTTFFSAADALEKINGELCSMNSPFSTYTDTSGQGNRYYSYPIYFESGQSVNIKGNGMHDISLVSQAQDENDPGRQKYSTAGTPYTPKAVLPANSPNYTNVLYTFTADGWYVISAAPDAIVAKYLVGESGTIGALDPTFDVSEHIRTTGRKIDTDGYIINDLGNMTFEKPLMMRSLLTGQDDSITNVFGGEMEWDHWTIKLLAARGRDNGVTLRYGKNIIDAQQEENLANTFTGVLPYWLSTEGTLVTLPEKYRTSSAAAVTAYSKYQIADATSDFDTAPTVKQLRSWADAYIASNNIGMPEVSLTVSFLHLADTEEYKDIAPLEQVNLCDVVTVIFPVLGIQEKAKIIQTDWNVLAERYNSVSIGSEKSTLVTTLTGQQRTLNAAASRDVMQYAVDHGMARLNSQEGSNMATSRNSNGYADTITFMDSTSMKLARNCLRSSSSGLQVSKTGYNGSYDTIIDIEGNFDADFATKGRLTAHSSYIDIDSGDIYLSFSGSTINTNGDITFSGGAYWRGDQMEVPDIYTDEISGTVGSNIRTLNTWKSSATSDISTLKTWKTSATNSLSSLQSWKTSAASALSDAQDDISYIKRYLGI